MSFALAIVGVAFAALCVWLTMRIINRRERWAKWTLAIVIALAYPASLGPWCYLMGRLGPTSPVIESTQWLYRPLSAAEVYLLPNCIAGPFHEYHVWWDMKGTIAQIRDSL